MMRPWLLGGLALLAGCAEFSRPPMSSGTTYPSDGLNSITCFGLHGDFETPRVDPTYVITTRIDSTWASCHGTGFAFRVPGDAGMGADARDEELPRALDFTGPRMFVPTGPDLGTSAGAAYSISVANWANDSGGSAEEVVERIRRGMSAHESGVDSTSYVAPPETVRIGGVEALALHPFCADCVRTELYFVSSRRIVRIAYVLGIAFPGDRDAQTRLYELVASTFRWSDR